MKAAKAVKKGRKAKPKKPQKTKKTISLQAVAETPRRRYITMPETMEWYRPIKKPVTLRVDADVLAWFKKSGRGYQTRINRALRKLMKEEMKDREENIRGVSRRGR
jgi:uncharacterized protein (DUF4415 family)